MAIRQTCVSAIRFSQSNIGDQCRFRFADEECVDVEKKVHIFRFLRTFTYLNIFCQLYLLSFDEHFAIGHYFVHECLSTS